MHMFGDKKEVNGHMFTDIMLIMASYQLRTGRILFGCVIFIVALVSFFWLIPSSAQTENPPTQSFYRNLRLGDRGTDVLALQRFLNQISITRIANSGAGSLGNETSYFGNLTKNAVIRLQELYKDEILVPIGLTRGTGFVGERTRNKLNSLSVAQIPNGETPKQPETIVLKKGNFEIKILPRSMAQTKPEDPPSTMVIITDGQKAFDTLISVNINKDVVGLRQWLARPKVYDATGNTVNFGGYSIANLPSDGRSLYFNVPEVPPGEYAVSVTSSYGTSDEGLYTVTKKPQTLVVVPHILRISPSYGKEGATVTIYGENFSLTGNTIVSSFGNMPNISSKDGKEITFVMNTPFAQAANLYNLPFTIVVRVEIDGKKSNNVPFVLTK